MGGILGFNWGFVEGPVHGVERAEEGDIYVSYWSAPACARDLRRGREGRGAWARRGSEVDDDAR